MLRRESLAQQQHHQQQQVQQPGNAFYALCLDRPKPGALFIGFVLPTANRTPHKAYFAAYPEGFLFRDKVFPPTSQASRPLIPRPMTGRCTCCYSTPYCSPGSHITDFLPMKTLLLNHMHNGISRPHAEVETLFADVLKRGKSVGHLQEKPCRAKASSADAGPRYDASHNAAALAGAVCRLQPLCASTTIQHAR